MPENISWDKSQNLEAEIAELSRQIESKRQQLEASHGVVSDRELVVETIAEHFTAGEQTTTNEQVGLATPVHLNSTSNSVTGTISSYLDGLDDESTSIINTLIAMVPDRGIKKTITEAVSHSPFILDAFHDALVDRLYEELKSRGIVS